MLRGAKVVLRAVRPEDLPALYEWRMDLYTWLQGDMRAPWPQPFAEFRDLYERITRDPDNVEWAIEAGGELVGRCGLFKLDPLARNAELGITIGPDFRGRGFGSDTMRVLADYGFAKRNLHKLQLETLATNDAGLRAYRAAGFVEEGRRREHAWVDGSYVDVVVMGLLRSDWRAARG